MKVEADLAAVEVDVGRDPERPLDPPVVLQRDDGAANGLALFGKL